MSERVTVGEITMLRLATRAVVAKQPAGGGSAAKESQREARFGRLPYRVAGAVGGGLWWDGWSGS
jgi:hypothetical protein